MNCRHNIEKSKCAFCSKFPFEKKTKIILETQCDFWFLYTMERPSSPTQFSEARRKLASQGLTAKNPTPFEKSLSSLGKTYKSPVLAGRKKRKNRRKTLRRR
jgi:hypothetical protein